MIQSKCVIRGVLRKKSTIFKLYREKNFDKHWIFSPDLFRRQSLLLPGRLLLLLLVNNESILNNYSVYWAKMFLLWVEDLVRGKGEKKLPPSGGSWQNQDFEKLSCLRLGIQSRESGHTIQKHLESESSVNAWISHILVGSIDCTVITLITVIKNNSHGVYNSTC